MEKIKRKRQYQCPICKLHYTQKIWAEKCEAWCKTHPSCNLQITRHAAERQENIESSDNILHKEEKSTSKKTHFLINELLTGVFYVLIGIIASVSLFLFYDFLLTRTSSITTFYLNTKDAPFYMWYYIISTVIALVLFGIDVMLTVYLVRRTRIIGIKEQGGNATGVIIGAFAASCPVCSGILLALVGITGGLAAFPFKGLELKTLSVIFLALPLFFLIRRVRNPNCDGKCPVPKDATFHKKDSILFVALILFFVTELLLAYSLLKTEPVFANLFYNNKIATGHTTSYAKRIQSVLEEVNPKQGFQSSLILEDIVLKMVSLGIIDSSKMESLYTQRGGMPQNEKQILTKPLTAPLVINAQNASFLVNILWPIGLSNRMEINKQSPVNGPDVNNFASTGGWTLGKEANGGAYFNKYSLIPLTSAQEKRVQAIAESTYRPCCNNSTFFQDCNHGSAGMAIIELGVSQGLSDEEIYKTLLAFNSFWFPQNYLETALYFNVIKNTDWHDVDPKLALSKDYSSISGWTTHVDAQIAKVSGLLPKPQNGGSCGA